MIAKPRVEEERARAGGIAETLSQVRPPHAVTVPTLHVHSNVAGSSTFSCSQSIFGEAKKENPDPEEQEHRPR